MVFLRAFQGFLGFSFSLCAFSKGFWGLGQLWGFLRGLRVEGSVFKT